MLGKILEVGLWPYVGMGSQPLLRERLKASSAAKGILASQGLLYDTIVVPTLDFAIIPALADWLSVPALRKAIEEESLRFLRYPGMMGYAGNGAGLIVNLRFGKGTSNEWDWTQVSTFGSLPEALEAQLTHGSENIPDQEKIALRDAVLAASVEFQIGDDFAEEIRVDTNQDILHDAFLREQFGRFYGPGTIELNRLPGPEPNQIRFFSGLQASSDGKQVVSPYAPPKDGIDLTLAVAQLNVQLAMSTSIEDCDLSTFDEAATLLRTKLSRVGIRWADDGNFSRLLALPGVPDIQGAVTDGRLDLSTIWNARDTRNARKFRRWLRHADAQSGRDLARLYVDALRREAPIASMPVKVLRWAIIAAAGALASRVAGVPGEIALGAVGAVDRLFAEKWLAGYTPALFIDELRRIRIEPTIGS